MTKIKRQNILFLLKVQPFKEDFLCDSTRLLA